MCSQFRACFVYIIFILTILLQFSTLVLTARKGRKYVMVFTDGESNDRDDLQTESDKLHEVVDEVFAFGIGNGPNEDELKIIASNSSRGFGWEIMEDFSKYEYFIRNFILIQGGCATDKVKPFRIDERYYDKNITNFNFSNLTQK